MRWTGLLYGLWLAAAACGDETVGPPPGGDTTFMVNPRLVLLAVDDTMRLDGFALTASGDTLRPAVTWAARDAAIAAVSADGDVVGVAVGSAWVVGAGLGRADSSFVTVSPTPIAQPGLQLITNQLTFPLYLTAAPGDVSRLFVVEKPGRVRIVRAGALVARPFLDIGPLVSTGGEQGLLSMAFHPDYAQNGFVYVSYTNTAGDSRVVRYRVSATDPDSVDAASAFVILRVTQPFENHNGGLIAFGPDGYLYLAFGDGGSSGDPQGNGQDPNTLLGALLRVDVDGGSPYAIPPSNPFAGVAGRRPEIWAWGLRNPWRFSFDRLSGDLYVADVGQNAREEVNVQLAASAGGENYGWNIMEGLSCYNAASCSMTGLTLPVVDYPHTAGACSVTGGYVYRGSQIPLLTGRYLYADYCTGFIRSFRYVSGTVQDPLDLTSVLSPGGGVPSFGEDNDGELYVMTADGRLYRIVPKSPPLAIK